MVHPLGGVTVKIVFFPLNGPDHVRLFHPVCLHTHALSLFLNFLEFHFPLPDIIFGLTMAQQVPSNVILLSQSSFSQLKVFS